MEEELKADKMPEGKERHPWTAEEEREWWNNWFQPLWSLLAALLVAVVLLTLLLWKR